MALDSGCGGYLLLVDGVVKAPVHLEAGLTLVWEGGGR